jgi:hypothetical protein
MDSFFLAFCLSVFLSFFFFSLSFFVSFDYSSVVSVVLLLHLWKKSFMMRREKRRRIRREEGGGGGEECFPSFALSYSVLLSRLFAQKKKKEKTRTIKEKNAEENRDISVRSHGYEHSGPH